jgi:hypothetical protein
MKRGRQVVVAALAAAVIVGGGLVANTALAGYGNFSASYSGKTCNGYGATGADAYGAYAMTNATSASGLSLSECRRGFPWIEYCDEFGCFLRPVAPKFEFLWDEISGAYSSHAFHELGFLLYPNAYYVDHICTASWSGGTSSCP